MQRARHLAPWLLLAAFAASSLAFGGTWMLALAPVVALLFPLLAGRYVGERTLARWARRPAAGRPRARRRLRAPELTTFVAAVFAAATPSRGSPVVS